MKFLCIYKNSREGVPPTEQEMASMGRLIDEMTKAGVLLATEGCLPSRTGARIRRDNGTITVVDGPFTESKEIIGGFALIQTKTKDEAIAWTRRFLDVAGDGESELRQVGEFSPIGQ